MPGPTPPPIPTLERHVATNAEVAMPSFQSSTDLVALNPTVLGNLGSQLAIASSTKLAEIAGYNMGQNPEGDILPAFTKTDEAFVRSYSVQAQSTLGLQAAQMFTKGQETLAKSNKLSAAQIEDYTKNMSEGVDDILNNAPSTIKSSLSNELKNQLLQSTHQLNNRMVSEQKEDAKQSVAISLGHQSQQIYNTGASNTPESAARAKVLYEQANAQAESARAAGYIDRAQEETLKVQNKQNLYTGVYSAEATKARRDGHLPEFLQHMQSAPPAGVSISEWENIGKSVLGHVAALDALSSKDWTLSLSQLNLAATEGVLTPAMINQARTQHPEREAELNNFLTSYAGLKGKQNQSAQQIQTSIAGWSNPTAQAGLTSENRNKAYTQLQTEVLKKYPNKSPNEARTEVVMAAGKEVKQYTDEINAEFLSGNPQKMLEAQQSYLKVYANNPGNVLGVTQKAQQMYFAFQGQLDQGKSPEEAAAIAQKSVNSQTPQEQEANAKAFASFQQKSLGTRKQRLDFMYKNLPDLGHFTEVTFADGVAAKFSDAYESNFKALNGDEGAALKMTTHNFQAVMGATTENGYKQYSYLPVNKIMGIGSGANGVIQNDVMKQTQEQILEHKKAFDEGHVDFYYRIPERKGLDYAEKLFNKIHEVGKLAASQSPKAQGASMEYQKLTAELSAFNNGKPVEIERVYRGGQVEKFKLAVDASPSLALATGGSGQYVGDYNVRLRTENGSFQDITLVTDNPNKNIVYRPNPENLRNEYFKINGINPSEQKTLAQIHQEYINKNYKFGETVSPSDLQTNLGVLF